MALPNKGITTYLVGTALSTSSRDVGALCTHTNINKWSIWKPIRSSKITLTEADMYANNLGMQTRVYNSPTALYKAHASGVEWDYLKPTGGAQSPYRLGDFRNYDKDAQPWFTMTSKNGETSTVELEQGGSFGVKFVNGTEISWLTKLGVFNEAFNKAGVLDVGLLLSPTLSTTSNELYYYKINDVYDISDSDKQLTCKIPTSFSTGTYYVFPCLNNAVNYFSVGSMTGVNNMPTSYNWYMLPANYIQVKVSQKGSATVSNFSCDMPSYNVTVSNYTVTIHNIPLVIYNNGTVNETITVKVKFADDVSNNHYIYDNIVTVNKGSSTTITLPSAGAFSSYTSATGNPTMSVQLSSSYATKSFSFRCWEKE